MQWQAVGVGSSDAIVGLNVNAQGEGMPQLYLGNGQVLNMLAQPINGLDHLAVAPDKTVVGRAGGMLYRLLFDHPPQAMTTKGSSDTNVSAGSASTILSTELGSFVRLYTGERSFAIIDCVEKSSTPGTPAQPIKGMVIDIACYSLEQYYILVANGPTITTYKRVPA